MEGLKPGRIVYYTQDGVDIPAMVVKVWIETAMVNLTTFYEDGRRGFESLVPYSTDKAEGSWHWMYEGQATRGEATGQR